MEATEMNESDNISEVTKASPNYGDLPSNQLSENGLVPQAADEQRQEAQDVSKSSSDSQEGPAKETEDKEDISEVVSEESEQPEAEAVESGKERDSSFCGDASDKDAKTNELLQEQPEETPAKSVSLPLDDEGVEDEAEHSESELLHDTDLINNSISQVPRTELQEEKLINLDQDESSEKLAPVDPEVSSERAESGENSDVSSEVLVEESSPSVAPVESQVEPSESIPDTEDSTAEAESLGSQSIAVSAESLPVSSTTADREAELDCEAVIPGSPGENMSPRATSVEPMEVDDAASPVPEPTAEATDAMEVCDTVPVAEKNSSEEAVSTEKSLPLPSAMEVDKSDKSGVNAPASPAQGVAEDAEIIMDESDPGSESKSHPVSDVDRTEESNERLPVIATNDASSNGNKPGETLEKYPNSENPNTSDGNKTKETRKDTTSDENRTDSPEISIVDPSNVSSDEIVEVSSADVSKSTSEVEEVIVDAPTSTSQDKTAQSENGSQTSLPETPAVDVAGSPIRVEDSDGAVQALDTSEDTQDSHEVELIDSEPARPVQATVRVAEEALQAATAVTTTDDPDICILPDSAQSRARPERTGARAADTKIKTVIMSSLVEPVDVRERQCAQCNAVPQQASRLSWETMDFCREDCLAQYQTALGSNCAHCRKPVPSWSMGKFCVRFGSDVKQFCAPSCLEEHKKVLKLCSYCQKDMSRGPEGFLAPVGDQGQFKELCSKACMEKLTSTGPPAVGACAVCGDVKPVAVEVVQGTKLHTLCSEPCFAAFKFVNNVAEGRCDQCKKYFDKVQAGHVSVFLDDRMHNFCCKTCLNVFVLATRRIVPCAFCKVQKYNFDMIQKPGTNGVMACSLACLKSFEGGARRGPCDNCGIVCLAHYKTPVPGAALFFCSYKCAYSYKSTALSSPTSAADVPSRLPNSNGTAPEMVSAGTMTPQVFQHIVTKPPAHKEHRNKSVLCKPYMHNKGTSCRPLPCQKMTQTDGLAAPLPVPFPVVVPVPVLFAVPVPMPFPFPLALPVPIFIPTTRNSVKGILKEIKKINEKIPSDPFEAELLMMAEMVAGEKKQEVTDSESDGETHDTHEPDTVPEPETFSPEPVDTSNAFGEDMLQIALKMASEMDEPAVDMESVLTPSTITPQAAPTVDTKSLYSSSGVAAVPEETAHSIAMMRGRKRAQRGRPSGGTPPSKRGRRGSGGADHAMAAMPMGHMAGLPPAELAPPQRIEVEKPDANMRLKYTFGVNAWRHWVMQKNQELEKAMLNNRKIKPFKPDLLQLTADELNFSLCLFVKEVKKPSGQDYAPDTIYYLVLGVQQYLFENGRIDNIFTDTYYEKFTDCLDEVAKKFAILYNDSQYIVTRVEEEHLWESKQLGAHSPHVLLSTLMFFNTKHFNLVTVEEHMQLSFSHIMKHWKRNPNAPGVAKVPGSRNVLLRFYPPQSALEANSRKKKVYEQQENEENPLRCPVKLYEFYLSKCPESVKTRNDVFYLLPERSCVPDSPVWYSTMALGKEPLLKMLHRVKMVKEINVALLTS